MRAGEQNARGGASLCCAGQQGKHAPILTPRAGYTTRQSEKPALLSSGAGLGQPPLCASCGHVCRRFEALTREERVEVINWWCDACDERGLVQFAFVIEDEGAARQSGRLSRVSGPRPAKSAATASSCPFNPSTSPKVAIPEAAL